MCVCVFHFHIRWWWWRIDVSSSPPTTLLHQVLLYLYVCLCCVLNDLTTMCLLWVYYLLLLFRLQQCQLLLLQDLQSFQPRHQCENGGEGKGKGKKPVEGQKSYWRVKSCCWSPKKMLNGQKMAMNLPKRYLLMQKRRPPSLMEFGGQNRGTVVWNGSKLMYVCQKGV